MDVPLTVEWLCDAIHCLGNQHGKRTTAPEAQWAEFVRLLREVEQAYIRLGRADGQSMLWTAADIIDQQKIRCVDEQDFETAARWRELVQLLKSLGAKP